MELIYSDFEVLFGYLIKDCSNWRNGQGKCEHAISLFTNIYNIVVENTPNFKEIFITKTKKTMRTESMFTMEKCYGANEIFHPFSCYWKRYRFCWCFCCICEVNLDISIDIFWKSWKLSGSLLPCYFSHLKNSSRYTQFLFIAISQVFPRQLKLIEK